MQKKDAAKKKSKESQWDGQWTAPHGDDFYVDNEDWEVDGLGITGSSKPPPNFVGSTAFVTAKTLKSKLDSLEVCTILQSGDLTINKDTHSPFHSSTSLGDGKAGERKQWV